MVRVVADYLLDTTRAAIDRTNSARLFAGAAFLK